MSLYSDLVEVLTPYANKIKGLVANLGNLSNLETTDKSSIVAAINEAARSGGTEIIIDNTLTQSGQVADAKAAGDAINQLSADLGDVTAPSINMYDKTADNTFMGYVNANGVIIANNDYALVYVPITGGNTYTVSKTIGKIFNVYESSAVPVNRGTATNLASYANKASITVTTSANANYLLVVIWRSTDTITLSEMKNSVMVEEGSTAHTYHPYGKIAKDTDARANASTALQSLLNLAFFGDVTLLTSGTDLDNLTDGVTYSNTSALTASLIHCPISTGAVKIITFQYYGTYKAQFCIGAPNRTYYRTSGGSGFYDWKELGNDVGFLRVSPPDGITPVFGDEICPALSAFTGSGAEYDGTKWTFDHEHETDDSISATVPVESGATYLIALTVQGAYTGADAVTGVPAYLRVVLGNDEITFFAANDAYWFVALMPGVDGNAAFSITSVNHWGGDITGISIKKVVSYVPKLARFYNQNLYYVEGSNFNIGGLGAFVKGDNNVGVGSNSQVNMTTARWNTALGTQTQRFLKNGTGNTAIGASAQSGSENKKMTGCYNNCLGNATQKAITTGNWNNAVGNEAQLNLTEGCNNTSIGRRASAAMTTGNYNTHVGMWTGFMGNNPDPNNPDNRNTITASRQTLVGAQARQLLAQSDDLVAVGFGAKGDEKAVAIGAGAEASGLESIAIGYGVHTTGNKQVSIGSSAHSVILAGKRIIFNDDHTVTWEDIT